MDERTRRDMIDGIDCRQAEVLADMARRQAQPPLAPRMAPAPRPPAPTPRPLPPATPRQPAPPRLDRHALEAIGRALAVTKAELRKEFAQSLDDAVGVVAEALAATKAEHQREIAEMEKRVEHLERAKKGAKILDARQLLIGRRNVA